MTTEKCNGFHCKCMNLGKTCGNHHYANCEENLPITYQEVEEHIAQILDSDE